MNIKKLLGMTALACAFAANADTLYVDIDHPAAGDDPAEGRGSEEKPYWSIQAAVNAAQEDWTILVKPGAYTNNYATLPTFTKQKNRVLIERRIKLISTGGKDVTHIVGEFDTSSKYGSGPAGVRCVYVRASATGSRIEGFTLRDGATIRENDAGRDGGAGLKVDTGANAWLIDSVIRNCSGCSSGGLQGGTAIRCLIKDNISGAGDIAAEARWANLWNCVVTHNMVGKPYAGLSDAVATACTNVNCTIVFYTSASSVPSGIWGCDFRNCLSISHVAAPQELFVKADRGCPTYYAANSIFTTDYGATQVFASLIGDYRLLPTSNAIGAGDAAHLTTTFPLPDDITLTDFAGQAIPATGTINAGAVQEVGEITCGKLYGEGSQYFVNGEYMPRGLRWQPPAYPTLYTMRPEAGEVVYVSFGPGTSAKHCQALDGTFVGCGSPKVGTDVSFWYGGVNQTVWVSQKRGSDDENADGTKEKPYASLQYAIDHSVLGSYDNKSVIIKVEEGDYATGGMAAGGSVMTRAAVTRSGSSVRMVAVDGPAKTIIRGGTDTRCTYGITFVQGFTLTGANLTDSSKNGSAANGCTLVDCVVSNNVGGATLQSSGGGVRTKYLGNTAPTLIWGEDGNAMSFSYCLVAGNRITNRYVFHDSGSSLYNCTIVGNVFDGGVKIYGSPTRLYNCIVCDSPSLDLYATCGGDVVNRATYYSKPAGWTDAAVNFVDEAAGDYRLTTFSSAVGWGYADLSSFDGSGDYWAFGQYYSKWISWDLSGNLPEFTADGRTYAGCYQTAASVVLAAATVSGQNGGLSLDGEPLGTASKTILAESGSATFTIGCCGDATRPCIGFTANGVTNLFDNLPGGTRTFVVDDPSKAVAIEALYDSVWYVDAANGDDANTGYTPKTAKKTLAASVTNAAVVAKDTVLALPGIYNEGDLKLSAASKTKNRVIVPADVTVASEQGPDVTVIEGAPATADVHSSGCGSNATRCAFIRANGTLRGFTLRNGCTTRAWESDGLGGGANGGDRATARLVDCVVSNCHQYSGMIAYVSANRCRITDARAELGNAPGPLYCNLYNSYVARISGSYQVEDCYEVVGCTLVADAATGRIDSSNQYLYYYNCLIDGPVNGSTLHNCLLTTNVLGNVKPGYAYAIDGTRFVDRADVPYDAEGRPLKDSQAVDAGNPDYLTKVAVDPALDGAKGQRVYNGALDVGAYEYDWRKDYAAQLGCRTRIAVDEAAPEVVSEVNGVRLAADTALTLGLKKGTFIDFSVTVDAGTVGVYVNGELERTLAVGDNVFTLNGLKDGDKVRLACSAGGSALVKSAASSLGLILIFR